MGSSRCAPWYLDDFRQEQEDWEKAMRQQFAEEAHLWASPTASRPFWGKIWHQFRVKRRIGRQKRRLMMAWSFYSFIINTWNTCGLDKTDVFFLLNLWRGGRKEFATSMWMVGWWKSPSLPGMGCSIPSSPIPSAFQAARLKAAQQRQQEAEDELLGRKWRTRCRVYVGSTPYPGCQWQIKVFGDFLLNM